jgi:hypothetical protein
MRETSRGNNDVIRLATENLVDAFVEDCRGDATIRMKFGLNPEVACDIDRSGLQCIE